MDFLTHLLRSLLDLARLNLSNPMQQSIAPKPTRLAQIVLHDYFHMIIHRFPEGMRFCLGWANPQAGSLKRERFEIIL